MTPQAAPSLPSILTISPTTKLLSYCEDVMAVACTLLSVKQLALQLLAGRKRLVLWKQDVPLP